MRNIDVEWDDDKIYIKNRSNKVVMTSYDIEELAGTASDTMAWDIKDARGTLVRMVAQTGCGCSGIIKPYTVTPEYSGTLKRA